MPVKRRVRAVAAGAIIALIVAASSVDYTVEGGDTLGKIAKAHGVSVTALADANDISNPNLIHIGQVLAIPGEEGKPDEVYVVRRGDTLRRIASNYSTSASVLAEANNISNPNLIRIGQKIVVPGSGGSSPNPSPQPTPTPKPNPSSRSGKSHIVRSGETLNSIASKHGISSDQIAAANGIVRGRIYVGTRLWLDGPSYVAPSGGGESGTYTVRRGDRLRDIAVSHGTTISKLAELNGIANVNLIRSGQVLTLPGGSQWVCPVRNTRYFNDWGYPRGGGSRFHEGNDLFASRGTEVRAPVSGKVVQKQGNIGGNQVNLSGSDGIVYLNSHLDSYGKSGQVNAGDVIGYIGTTGNARGSSPHLHFGMYYNGLAINAYPSLVANDC